MSTSNIFTKTKIDTTQYVNTSTGETLFSEYPSITSINVRDMSKAILNSEEYINIDSKAMRYIETIFSATDIAKILRLSNMVKGPYNILLDKKGIAHVPKTLRQSLEYDESEFCRFMKRLHLKSVINYIIGYKGDKKCKWIMLNPTLSRKSKTFHKDCLNVFDDLSKKSYKNSFLHKSNTV